MNKRQMINLRKFIKGSTLVEVTIAVGVAVVGLFALVQIGTKSINNSGFSVRKSQASTFAGQALEVVRREKQDLGWINFKAQHGGGAYCGSNLNTGCCGVGNEFTSCVYITYSTDPSSGVDQMQVVSEVAWTEGNEGAGRTVTTRQETLFTRY